MTDRLSRRELNRATLARQSLLTRNDLPAEEMVRHLVGLQAQEARDPYIGLWARLVDFRVDELEQLLLERRVVRLVVQRGTIHAVTADDCFLLRRLAQPTLTQQLFSHRDHGPRLRAIDLPPRGLWSTGGEVVATTAQAWLGRTDDGTGSVDDVVLRYLGAFGPASVADAATWSRYTGLAEVFGRLGRRVRRFVDADGGELFDLPDAPRPDADVPAPVRFLPQYDNVLLSHADRRRVADRDFSEIWMGQVGFVGSLLVDGMLRGMWRFDRPFRDVTSGRPAVLTVTTSPRLARPERDDVLAEAEAFTRFVAPHGTVEDIRLVDV